ncbi:MAG TPA: DUF58 domain-containing protein [Acidimicrobiia bacterium]|nr:DUF58 domain-containing protein [Acidimicrobiia bacterium]
MRRLLRPALALGVLAVLTRVDPVLGVVVLLAGWAWTSWWLPPRRLAGLSGDRRVPERAMFGDAVPVELVLDSTRSVPWISVFDMVPFDLGPSTRWVTTAVAGGSSRFHRQVVAARRGLHRIGPAIVSTGDLFGLRTVQQALVPSSDLLVYPRIVPLKTLELAAGAPLPFVPTTVPLQSDPTRIVGVREYEPGDPMRTIHWTASAAAGSLLVKKHRPATSRDVLLTVDLSRSSHPSPGRNRSVELAIAAAASIAHHLVTVRRESVGLRLYGRDTPSGSTSVVEVTPGRDEVRLGRMLEHLARTGMCGSSDGGAVLDVGGLPYGASVVLFTGQTDREHVRRILRLLRAGVVVDVVVTARQRSEWDTELEGFGVAVRSLARLGDLVSM